MVNHRKFSLLHGAAVTEEPVVVSVDGAVMTIRINRPEPRNAVNAAVRERIHAAVWELDSSPSLRVGILTGTGDRAFCAGADLHEMATGAFTPLGGEGGGFAGFVQHPRTKPLIAAVNGLALGGGFEVVLACDLVIAVPSARFGLPEPTRGVMAGAGGVVRLPHRIPPAVANEVLLAGKWLTAAEGLHWGLLNRVCEPEDLMGAATGLAEEIARAAPLSIRKTREVAAMSREDSEKEAWRANDEAMRLIRASRDAREGPAAFAEKRPPIWTGE